MFVLIAAWWAGKKGLTTILTSTSERVVLFIFNIFIGEVGFCVLAEIEDVVVVTTKAVKAVLQSLRAFLAWSQIRQRVTVLSLVVALFFLFLNSICSSVRGSQSCGDIGQWTDRGIRSGCPINKNRVIR